MRRKFGLNYKDMKENIRAFVLDKVQSKEKLPEMDEIDDLKYIDEGYVDSIGLIKFIVEIETEFDIEIDDDDIASLEFRTIGGLCSLINNKINTK
tara:strand:- start:204 stop:488 length:285 start_codon:yes stop_codon:yes gene_type:complete